MTHYPNSKDVAFFIISLNTTEQKSQGCENHHGEQDKPPPRYLHMVSSSDTLANVSGTPESSNFEVIVYLVDDNRDVYRSEQFSLETAEGGEYHLFFFFNLILLRYITCNTTYYITLLTILLMTSSYLQYY